MFRNGVVTIVAFGLYFFLLKPYFSDIYWMIMGWIASPTLAYISTYVLIGLPMLIATPLIHPLKSALDALGLKANIGKPLLAAMICTMPMFVGYGILSGFEIELSKDQFVRGVLCAAFFEELFFRGFLFGQLFRKTRAGFIPAALAGALFFGAAHIYQGNTFLDALGVFGVTFMGAGFFSWVYTEWNYNLWGAVFLHLFMNLSWTMFAIDDNALGGVWANVLRAVTIALVIIGTLRYKRRNQIPLTVQRNNIWIRQSQ